MRTILFASVAAMALSSGCATPRGKTVLEKQQFVREMRGKTLEIKGMKGWSTRHQRKIYKTLKVTGLHWLF